MSHSLWGLTPQQKERTIERWFLTGVAECPDCNEGFQCETRSSYSLSEMQWYPEYRDVPCGTCHGDYDNQKLDDDDLQQVSEYCWDREINFLDWCKKFEYEPPEDALTCDWIHFEKEAM